MEEKNLDFKDRIIVRYMNLLTQQTHNVQTLLTKIELLEEELASLKAKEEEDGSEEERN
ncbi:hypothetical protein [Anaerococcus sp. Marseille-P3915]|uniref:hypothetical protein n=1 Tax=Anaerococcus sp. Marseille-P3915 TaxID=2057799 RepID=UPI00131A1BFD|nr:hypothetical protein [Anaerococcus sp. Marseille-P3915]